MIIVAALLAMMVFLFIRNIRSRFLSDSVKRFYLVILAGVTFLMLTGILAGGENCVMSLSSLLMGAVPAALLLSSNWRLVHIFRIGAVFLVLMIFASIYNILVSVSVAVPVPLKVSVGLSSFLGIICAILFALGFWNYVSDMRRLMKGTSVFQRLSAGLESVYAIGILVISLLPAAGCVFGGTVADVSISVASLMAAGALLAVGYRLVNESYFAVMRERERRMIESMSVSQMENLNICGNETYKEIFDRIVDYFEEEKPYLDNNLTINEVVRNVYSNKLYISRAISRYTGRNFCQFVNYYRILYSMEAFRNDTKLKVSELAEMSGFNSTVTYSTAFRLFMNENPGDWCRKERNKVQKKKK